MLLLDSEALSSLAHGPEGRRDRVRALIRTMHEHDQPVAIVSAALAEVIRGHPRDAAIFGVLGRDRVQVHDVDRRTGVRAGQLLGSVGAGSEDAIDAFIIAVADLAGGAVVATADHGDLTRLSATAARVAIVDISG